MNGQLDKISNSITERLNDKQTEEIDCLLDKIRDLEIELTAKEAYDKRLNILVHGVEEEGSEQKEQTRKKFEELLRNGLNTKPSAVSIVDIHRPPQYTSKKLDGTDKKKRSGLNC